MQAAESSAGLKAPQMREILIMSSPIIVRGKRRVESSWQGSSQRIPLIHSAAILVVCCWSRRNRSKKMRRTFLFALFSLLCIAALGQAGPVPAASSANGQNSAQVRAAPAQGTQPVSYASISQLNGMLAQLEASAKSTQPDLAKLRIDRWKTDSGTKKQSLANVDSIQRHLQGALP